MASTDPGIVVSFHSKVYSKKYGNSKLLRTNVQHFEGYSKPVTICRLN